MKPPDVLVTGKVVADLKERRLLRDEDLVSVAEKLVSGRAKVEDWRVWAEKALSDPKGGHHA
jgi:hypothetical protein